jgi:hypothetical protein
MPVNDPTDRDEPIAQYLKVVHLLRCAPGFAEEPLKGVPIGIVTVEHDSEVEQPMLLKIRDMRFLCDGLLRALSYHGDEDARNIIEAFPELHSHWHEPGT